jgi:ATP-dependent 26S proteasome regulatory subunit
MPEPSQRCLLWKNAFSTFSNFEANINFEEIADKYEISGGAITNVVRFCSLKAYKRNDKTIQKNDIIIGIKKEMKKEGKVVR